MELTEILENILKLTGLKTLAITASGLETITPKIVKMEKLEYAYLFKNKIKEFPCILENLKALKVLALHDNGIPEQPECVINFKELEDLRLRNNKIVTIPVLKGKIEKLKNLEVEKNLLDEISRIIF